jgi:hypothetical protein
MSLSLDVVAANLSALRPGIKYDITGIDDTCKRGCFNRHFPITFEDGVKWILRVRKVGRGDISLLQMIIGLESSARLRLFRLCLRAGCGRFLMRIFRPRGHPSHPVSPAPTHRLLSHPFVSFICPDQPRITSRYGNQIHRDFYAMWIGIISMNHTVSHPS